jgi:hypothetical protein
LACLLLAASPLAAALTAFTGLAALLASLALLPGLAALRLLPACLTGLTLLRLAGLAGLTVAGELARLELLAAGLAGTAGLSLSRLSVGRPAEAGQLVAQPGQIVHGPVDRGVLGSVLRTAYGASRVPDLLTQLLQIAGEAGFERI